jgi:hypothetical protein
MSADKKLMDVLAETRPRGVESTRRPDPAAIMAHARMSEAREIVRRPSRRLVLAGAVPAVAAIVAGVVFLGSRPETPDVAGGGGPATGAPVTPASARELLLVAANRSASATATTGKYQVVTEEQGDVRPVGPADRPYDIVRRTAFERWYPTAPGGTVTEFFQSLGATPATDADAQAWKADGSPTRWVEQPPKDMPDAEPVTITTAPGERGYVQDPAEQYVTRSGHWYVAADLPTDPAELRRSLLRQWKAYSGEELSDFELFHTGVDLALNLRLPPQVGAAAFRMLADIDGVAVLGEVRDRMDRSGVAVGYARKGDSGHWSQIRVIIEPRTGQPLADESWDLGRDNKAGELMRYRLVVGSRYTDEAPPIGSATPRR